MRRKEEAQDESVHGCCTVVVLVEQNRKKRFVFVWIELNCKELNGIELNLIELNVNEFNGIELNLMELN
jgi:hypothetical protein